MAMTLATLTALAAQFASDQNQTRYQGLYTQFLNLAMDQFVIDTKCLFKDQAYSVVSGTSLYTLPSDFMYEKKVTFTTNTQLSGGPTGGKRLKPITRSDLEFYKTSADWTQDQGTPRYYIIDPEVARQQLVLYPQPQGADAGTSNLLLTYYPFPTDMAAASDTPFNSSPFLTQFDIALAYYTAYLLMSTEPKTPETIAAVADMYKKYEAKVTECIDKFGNTVSAPMRMKGGRSW